MFDASLLYQIHVCKLIFILNTKLELQLIAKYTYNFAHHSDLKKLPQGEGG